MFCFVCFGFLWRRQLWFITNVFEISALPPKIEAQRCFPLRAPFIVFIYESSTLRKAYRIKVSCYWEHIGKLMGTQWEHIGDNRESLCPRAKPQKKKNKQTKKTGPLWVHAQLLIGCMKIMVTKLFVAIALFCSLSLHTTTTIF
jgi:hypothetical protein